MMAIVLGIYGFAVFTLLLFGLMFMICSAEEGFDSPDYVSAKMAVVWCWMPVIAIIKIIKYREWYFNGDEDDA